MRRYYRRRRSSSGKANLYLIGIVIIFLVAVAIIKAIYDFVTNNTGVVIFLGVAAALAISGYFVYKYLGKIYERFVLEHSVAMKKLQEINSNYKFEEVPDLHMTSSYDNENFFIDISPLDYITYQLVYQKNSVLSAIGAAEKNAKNFPAYLNRVGEIQEFDRYDAKTPLFFEKFGRTKEKQLFSKMTLNPKISFTIRVVLNLTNINGAYKDSKYDDFSPNEIREIIEKLSQKRGDFFTDENIWQSICRVERGKVTNKVRFAVYNRDGNRCRRCGSTHDLEVDHIFPISKGGKSNFENLQTLCHNCNVAKSNKVESGATNPNEKRRGNNEVCTHCGAPLVLRSGRNGNFYGCSNYPDCKFTKSI